MEYLLLAIVLYFILRTTGNLVRLLGGRGEAAGSQKGQVRDSSPRRDGWQGPSPRQQTGSARNDPTFWGEDIEDATWRDLAGETRSPPNAPR